VDITKLCFEYPPAPGKPGRDLCSDCAVEAVRQGKRVDLIAEPVVIDLGEGQ